MKNIEKNKEEKRDKNTRKIIRYVPDFTKSDDEIIKKKLKELGYWGGR